MHWFYKVVRRTCCFYIGFTKVVREKPYKTCVKSTFFVDNPPWTTGMVLGQEEEQDLNCPYNSPSYTIESLISRSLARTHARTKRNDFPVGGFTKGLTPPTSNLPVYLVEPKSRMQLAILKGLVSFSTRMGLPGPRVKLPRRGVCRNARKILKMRSVGFRH